MTGSRDLAAKRRLLSAALVEVPFDGWSERTLRRAASAAGLGRSEATRLFPGGVGALVAFHLEEVDSAMLAELARRDLAAMRVRDRIQTAVRVRLELQARHREAVRRTLAYLALPGNGRRALSALGRTVDRIWRAAGDQATDFNYYTKRALLAGVYGATVLFWLDDDSDGHEATWAFLDRRIDEVMSIEKARGRVAKRLDRLPSPWRALGRLRYGRAGA
ncbi:MAG: COQ9 family protein [Alphaproteobacteria bacterium]|jgi:ubiquinone biosynthesis protein COQ9|nr:COQ9 family protein [Alphaproteobacteria bacterium]